MKLEDDAWGWNAGVGFTLSPSKVGVSYRSQIKYHTTGDVTLADDGTGLGTATAAAMSSAGFGYASDLKASLTMPETFILSVDQKLSDKWEMLGDVSWTGWSSIPKVDIMRTSGIRSTSPATAKAQTLETDFRDTWRVALGANYAVNDAWKLKFGIAYDQTPVKKATSRLTAMPDNDRVWLSFGAQCNCLGTTHLEIVLGKIYTAPFQRSHIHYYFHLG